MIVVGTDTHKYKHALAAVDEGTGGVRGGREIDAGAGGASRGGEVGAGAWMTSVCGRSGTVGMSPGAWSRR
jgi:hypothetical protein